jgi:hypothetical protein
MPRNKTLFLYNTSKSQRNQAWRVYSEHVIDQTFTVGDQRKSFTITLGGDANIQFGVDDTVYLRATYNYKEDSWKHQTDTPNEISFSVSQSAVTVSSSYEP